MKVISDEVLRGIASQAGRGAVPATVLAPPRKTLPCIYDGGNCPSPNGPDGRTYVACEAGKGVVCKCNCNPTKCDRYTADAEEPADVSVGVVLGHWSLAPLIELQIRVIRDLCGPIPILVNDDRSPEPHQSQLQEICSRLGVELTYSGRKRIGHAGGDLGAFYNGLRWAVKNKLHTLVKLSQRFVITRPRWAQEVASELLTSKSPTLSNACLEGVIALPLRSEAVALRVADWDREDVYRKLRPRTISPYPAEGVVADAAAIAGSLGIWSLLGGVQRCSRTADVVWHTSNNENEYRDLAARYGIDLGPDFTCVGWIHLPTFAGG